MTFTSFPFVVLLLLVFTLYWACPYRRGQNLIVVAASFVFYGWWDWRFLWLMIACALIDYVAGYLLSRLTARESRLATLAGAMSLNLGILGVFKYFNFFAENLQVAATALGWRLDPITLQIVLPIGISFYTFQSMSYTIDVYRGNLKPTSDIVDYLAFVTFFPQLVAGPIERATNLLPQFQVPRRFDYARATDGARQILWGFFKKMVVADNLGPIVTAYYHLPDRQTGPELAFATVLFGLQIYCDFSAYSDIATGTARWFGIDLMRNFAYPYFSQSPGEFWRRWHISLSTWFRDYVYVPLGGRRVSPSRTITNLLTTFTLSGLWHGASWNFVIWGALNGLAVVPTVWGRGANPTSTPGGERLVPRPGVLLRMAGTFAFITLTWVFFRATTFPTALLIIKSILVDAVNPAAWLALPASIQPYSRTIQFTGLMLLLEWVQRRHLHPLKLEGWPFFLRWSTYTAIVWVILYYGTHAAAEFIYFQF
jgi:D-alanyl-lipoteichoic acid acyltransferase DltB (MBOAT superfamily)